MKMNTNQILKKIATVSVMIFFMVLNATAAPVVRIVMEPSKNKIETGSGAVAVKAQATGKKLSFQWNLLGPGKLEGPASGAAVFYTPPSRIEGSSERAIISVKVLDANDEEANESVFIDIIGNMKKEIKDKPGNIDASVGKSDIKILSPTDGDTVSGSFMTTGTYNGTVDEDIWVFVWPEKANGKGWPQSDDALIGKPALKRNGKWAVTCYFGGVPQKYEISVCTASEDASISLKKSLRNWFNSNDYKGLHVLELPDGLTEKDRITVFKKY